MRIPILERIERRVLVADGAMGTMIYAKGIPFSRCFDALNLEVPTLVKEIHLGYVKAGAELIETNTFGATRPRLAKYGLEDKVGDINTAGARLAREVAGDDLYVAGSVGPLGLRLEPLGPTSLGEARALFREQIAALADAGVDLIVLETMIELTEARQALSAAREAGIPVIAQMSIQEDGNTPSGASPEVCARQLDEAGADLIGLNCSVGPAGLLDALERMAKTTSKRLSAQPNAGLPRVVEGRSIYLCSPEYMAEYARRYIACGARVVGGCCGTTPEHIRAIKKAVRSFNPSPARHFVEVRERQPLPVETVPVEKRSRLAARLAEKRFPILVEMVPPKGCDATREIEGALFLRDQQIDAVSISGGTGSTARMSALSLAALVQQRTGLETVLDFGSRGRSVSALQSGLLGASALGLANVVAVTGDPPSPDSDTSIASEYAVDSIGLVNLMSQLNQGRDAGDNPLGSQTAFLIGVRVNPAALNLDEEVRRFEYKVEAGANFALASAVFDVAQLDRFLKRIEVAGAPPIPVLAGIVALTSFRHGEFLNNEVPGVSIPRSIMDRMRKADTGDQARAEGLAIAREMLIEVRNLVQGAQIAAPFSRYALAVEVAQPLAPAPPAAL
jgi:methionine synthase / methylenetetrahydrofolate reductase(NADPH)